MRKLSHRTRKQKGGVSKLYHSVDQITPQEIERIFCSGKAISELPSSETPFFILKWGPPGSGKSSAKVVKQIEQLGVPITEYVDFTPDKVIEALMPFRFESSQAKLRNMRINANLSIQDYAHARLMLQSARVSSTPATKNKIDEWLRNSSSGAPSKNSLASLKSLQEKILYNSISESYRKMRGTEKNKNGLTIREKMDLFLEKAMNQNKNIQCETMGSGYNADSGVQILRSEFTGKRATAGRALGQIEIFRNKWEELLGKIVYDEANKPVSVEGGNRGFIPENYTIIVVYPILPRDMIVERASLRAMKQLMKPNSFSFEKDSIETYNDFLLQYGEELHNLLFKGGAKEEALKDELASVIAETSEESDDFIEYIQGIKEQLADKNVESISFPMFRAISPEKIMDVAEQAFQYSVDYFLHQYILLGRIKSVIYVSNI